MRIAGGVMQVWVATMELRVAQMQVWAAGMQIRVSAMQIQALPPAIPIPGWNSPIRTHLDARGDDGSGIRSRNHINILSSDVHRRASGISGYGL